MFLLKLLSFSWNSEGLSFSLNIFPWRASECSFLFSSWLESINSSLNILCSLFKSSKSGVSNTDTVGDLSGSRFDINQVEFSSSFDLVLPRFREVRNSDVLFENFLSFINFLDEVSELGGLWPIFKACLENRSLLGGVSFCPSLPSILKEWSFLFNVG